MDQLLVNLRTQRVLDGIGIETPARETMWRVWEILLAHTFYFCVPAARLTYFFGLVAAS
jgi:hypothetical protein